MNLATIIDTIGAPITVAMGGLLIGMVFGAAAQRSKFCLRAAAIEFGRGQIGKKVSIWLLVFTAAVTGTQFLLVTDTANLHESRFLSTTASMSGAILGGAMFGAGMILSRGCSSRLLVLAATGNLRSVLSGLVFAVTAQASLHGVLSPLRGWLAGLWTIAPENQNIITSLGLPEGSGFLIAALWLAGAFGFAIYNKLETSVWIGAVLVGSMVMAGWYFTNAMSENSFDIIPIESLTFTGPSADTLMFFLSPPDISLFDFDIGLVPGVFLGSFLAAFFTNELKIVGFTGGMCMWRYLIGATLMGFGGMLAGGCAVGAGVTGGSVFALTAWVALFSIWLSAMGVDWLIDRNEEENKNSGSMALNAR